MRVHQCWYWCRWSSGSFGLVHTPRPMSWIPFHLFINFSCSVCLLATDISLDGVQVPRSNMLTGEVGDGLRVSPFSVARPRVTAIYCAKWKKNSNQIRLSILHVTASRPVSLNATIFLISTVEIKVIEVFPQSPVYCAYNLITVWVIGRRFNYNSWI